LGRRNNTSGVVVPAEELSSWFVDDMSRLGVFFLYYCIACASLSATSLSAKAMRLLVTSEQKHKMQRKITKIVFSFKMTLPSGVSA
jgi:hypothetical protein